MGSCHETRADRTRSIIDEDYRIKQEMIRNLYYNSRVQQEFVPNPYEERRIHYYPMQNFLNAPKTIVNNEKIISKNRSVLTDVYKLEKQVGEGGYGQVFLVRHKKMNLLRAMKVIPINSKNEQEKTDEEIELLKQLDHPNIVKLFEYFSDSDKYYLITEYCKGGDLFDLIKVKKRFSELSSAYIMYQIFLALFYCHKTNHLIHRDIKPENIVVVRKNKIGEELYDVKLIDFGISKIFNKVEANSDISAGIEGWLRFLEENASMESDQPEEDSLLDHFSNLISGCGKNIEIGSRVNLLGRCYDFMSEGRKLNIQYQQSDKCEEKGTIKITSSRIYGSWYFRDAPDTSSFPTPYHVEEHTLSVKTQDEVDKEVLMWCLEL